MSKISDDISKDLKDQPKFTSDIGDKAQDHHTFDIGEQTFLKNLPQDLPWTSKLGAKIDQNRTKIDQKCNQIFDTYQHTIH